VTTRPLTIFAVIVSCCLPAGPAQGTGQRPNGPSATAAQARSQAQAAAREVAAIDDRLQVAQQRYVEAVRHIGETATGQVLATEASDLAQLQARQAVDRTGATARALYQGSGSLGLLSSLLGASNVTDLGSRMRVVRRVLQATDESAQRAQLTSAAAVAEVSAAQARAHESVITAEQVAQRAAEVDSLLGQAQERLDSLSAQATQLAEAEAARAAAAKAATAVRAGRVSAPAHVRAQLPPSDYFALYHAAATTCPGMEWTLLAAVGQVESGHGRNVGPSSAGAIGPMQFMPRTFAAYAVDGNHDGVLDAFNPADAIYTAAHYLCANGGGNPATIRKALFAYNRANWYVDLVLGVQRQIAAGA
jgi:soluble lytic murein transglycosylase-like protein